MEFAIVILILSPAFLSVMYGLYCALRWVVSRRNATIQSQIVVGALGPLAIMFPRLMSEKSKHYLSRFVGAGCFFILYCGVLFLLFER
jgi:hypothetical protein